MNALQLQPSPIGLSAAGPATTLLIDSLLHPMALLVRQVLGREGRRATNLLLIDDEENIAQALQARLQLHSLFITTGKEFPAALRSVVPPSTPVYEVSAGAVKKLFGNDKLARLFALAEVPRRVELESLSAIPGDIIVLENLSISGNIGAIIRTALALGAGALVLLNTDPADLYDRRLIRASRGHVFAMPIVATTTSSLLDFCKQHGLELLVTASTGEVAVDELAGMQRRLVMAFGAEKDGCSPDLVGAAAARVRIPLQPGVESLNVSAAAAIVLYQRSQSNPTRSHP